MRRRIASLVTLGAGLLMAAGLLLVVPTALVAPTTAASAATCTLFAGYPYSNGNVSGYAQISCTSAENIQVEACLQQLVTGGWQNVVGSCQTSQYVHGKFISATGRSYYPTCGRWYRSWAWSYINGVSGNTVNSGDSGQGGTYKGCS